jgi:transglutaminase/protease-like cytokinesis protein 3
LNTSSHTPGPAATEQSAQSCTQCGYVIAQKLEHTHKYGTSPKYDLDNHWYECSCGHIGNKQAHADSNKDSKCDTCKYKLPPVTSEGENLEDILGPAQITLLRPVASGVLTKSNSSAIIDYSNYADGYVMVKYIVDTTVRLKVQVQGPSTTYTYNISPHEWNVFPLSDGNGAYTIKVFKNTSGNRYSVALSLKFDAKLSDEFAPFLRPNQYVNYENAVNSMNKAAEIVAGKSDTLDKVAAIYNYIIKNISYDYEKAETIQSGYLPDLDQVLAEKKGICFDYAALMAGMLRSQNIACKLVVGYADTAYHAWISVWTPDKGWIDGAIFFDGVKWQLMDPTYASALGSSIINKVNYTSKYIY